MSEPVIRLEGLFLRHHDHLAYGPLDLNLAAGRSALIVAPDLDLLRRLMRCCQGLEEPDRGRVSWWPGAPSAGNGAGEWAVYEFYSRIGYIDRRSQLLGSLTLLQNFLLFHRYAKIPHGPERSRRALEAFGLADYQNLRADELPELQRRLALYALTLEQHPRLMLMERPLEFLEQDFDLVWDLVLSRAAGEGLACIVFDRTRSLYSREAFDQTLTFSPGAV
ncbi:MAG: hypothetical protein LBP33_00225 [Candidatus Adiutrix sp.]|jgi:polar amino acid transport system ATP-binding protein|nr:hypothetical protein [Candidatus Adiutrix sp.]